MIKSHSPINKSKPQMLFKLLEDKKVFISHVQRRDRIDNYK